MRFPSLVSWRGWKVVDRGRGFQPSFSPSPVTPTEIIADMNRVIDEKFGLADCPECGLRVAVLVHGVCRDCGPEAC